MPFPTSVNSDNHVQLIQHYEIHVGWMNANTNVFAVGKIIIPTDCFWKDDR